MESVAVADGGSAGSAGADTTGNKTPGLLASTAHALRRKMKNPSSRRIVEDASSKKSAPGGTDEEESDRESVRSASDVVVSDSSRAMRRRLRSVSPPPRQRERAAVEARPPDQNRVKRAVNRIAVGQAGARRRLFQRLKRGSRIKKFRSYSASEAGLLLGDGENAEKDDEAQPDDELRGGVGCRRRRRRGSSVDSSCGDEDEDVVAVRGLLATSLGSLGSLGLSAATAAVTICLVLDHTPSVLLRIFAVLLSLASLASHSAAATRHCVDLAEVALGENVGKGAQPVRALSATGEDVEDDEDDDEEEELLQIVMLSKDESKGADQKLMNAWWSPDHSYFNLRGQNYLNDGVKTPSAPMIYDPIAAFVVSAPRGAIRNVTDLPQVREIMAKFCVDEEDEEKVRNLSRLPRFLFSCMNLPLEAPSLRPTRQGTKYAAMVTVFSLSEYARSFKDEEDWPPALRLAETWMRTSDTDHVMNGRLKGIFNAHNTSSIPRVATKWNAKPVLMASNASFGGSRVSFFLLSQSQTQFVLSQARPGISLLNRGNFGGANTYVEFNIDVGESFSYIARGAIYLIQSRLATMGPLDIAMTVEGRLPEELPETLLMGIVFHKIDPSFPS